MRHGLLSVFQQLLSIAGDNVKQLEAGEIYVKFIYELCSPLTHIFFLQNFLSKVGCTSTLSKQIFGRMNCLNSDHHQIFVNNCSQHLTKDMLPFLFKVIIPEEVKTALSAPAMAGTSLIHVKSIISPMLPVDPASIINTLSFPNLDIVYSVASSTQSIKLDENMGISEVAAAFQGALDLNHSLQFAAFIVDKKQHQGVLLKSPGIKGPFFAVLNCDNGECGLVTEIEGLFTDFDKQKAGRLLRATFPITGSQFFIGCPNNLTAATNYQLHMEIPWMFYNIPSGDELMRSFQSYLETKNVGVHVDIAYGFMQDLA